jgi:beta-lactamase class A
LNIELNRRSLLGLGAATAAGVALGSAHAAPVLAAEAEPDSLTPAKAATRIRNVYERESADAGGSWHCFASVASAGGGRVKAVADDPDLLVEAFSVNKIAVALAVLDKIDRNLLTLDQRVDVTAEIVIPAVEGIFALDGAYPSSVTLGHVLAALLTVSDDTAVRLCGLVCPALELNAILVAKGFPNTQVVPVANPNRFFLGQTTPRETHDLLQQLVAGTLLSPGSTAYLLNVLRSLTSFNDGIRRIMSSDERLRVATKAGWFADGRNEAGIMFDPAGTPALIYAMFANGQADPDNFGATHPAVDARARMGRKFLDTVDRLPAPATAMARMPAPEYHPFNGG